MTTKLSDRQDRIMDVQSRLISASFTLGAAAGVTLGLALGVLFSAFLSF